MSCCSHARSAGRFFSFFARRYRKRLASKGLDPIERTLLGNLERAGFENAAILEIGCGVGYLHQVMLERGAARAYGVDLAPRMLDEARALARERGLADRVRYREGDFMDLAPEVAPYEVTLLDRVICCYPDAEGLLGRTLERTERMLGLVYPRNRWFTRLGAGLTGLALRFAGSDFRPYVHDPERVRDVIGAAGFEQISAAENAVWQAEVWVRGGAS